MPYSANPIRFFHNPSISISNFDSASTIFENESWLNLHTQSNDKDYLELYHYTNYEGLLGIIQNRSLFATHYSALNDPQEIIHGRKLILSEVMECLSGAKGNLKRYYEQIKRYMEASFRHVYANPFITCFCENGDLLSQWRGYGSTGTGYSLGFQFHATTKRISIPEDINTKSKPAFLRKVIYKDEQKRKLVKDYLAHIQEAVEKDLELDPSRQKIAPNVLGQAAGDLLIDMIMSFKDEAFSEENEWRLIHAVMPSHEPNCLNFSNSPTGIKSYRVNHVVDIENDDERKFPCFKITAGPGLDSEQSELNLNLLAERERARDHKIKLGHISTQSSKFSFR